MIIQCECFLQYPGGVHSTLKQLFSSCQVPFSLFSMLISALKTLISPFAVFGCAFLVESVWVMERCALPNPWQYHAALCIVAGHVLAGNNSDITAIKYILAG